MSQVKIGDSVDHSMPLWRYMSLDKLVHLLETDSFYFTPLESYSTSDPFEGFIPQKAFDSYGQIFAKEVKELQQFYQALENQYMTEGTNQPELKKMKDGIDDLGQKLKETYKLVHKAITVNCWHANPVESEAMWKLYSDNGKGVAIKTSVSKLFEGLTHFEQDVLVQMGAVKYMDFNDTSIDGRDCVTDGHLAPLLKRSSFSHENEVRLFVSPEVDMENPYTLKAKPNVVSVSAEKVIEAVYISPFAGEPYTSSVKAICNKYNIPHEIVCESKLLNGHEALLESIVAW